MHCGQGESGPLNARHIYSTRYTKMAAKVSLKPTITNNLMLRDLAYT